MHVCMYDRTDTQRSLLAGPISCAPYVRVQVSGRAVAVEVEGNRHFTRGATRSALGSNRLRDRLLRARGYPVASIPEFEWVPLLSSKSLFARQLYLKGKLEAALREQAR